MTEKTAENRHYLSIHAEKISDTNVLILWRQTKDCRFLFFLCSISGVKNRVD
ncbi:hypothetical protein APS_0332 [Acetobacter pasteurianus subsp. pasteurianus LMG 1262 = NBRC 106471]|nr:hypothetical protein APS_0332 [Acetobacter pasteurianus subsp. pasteurianus LMG 1262 = NBRC 106471]